MSVRAGASRGGGTPRRPVGARTRAAQPLRPAGGTNAKSASVRTTATPRRGGAPALPAGGTGGRPALQPSGPAARGRVPSVTAAVQRRRNVGGLLLVTAALCLFGLATILASSSVFAYAQYGDSLYFFTRHLLYALAGAVVLIVLWRLDYRTLRWANVPLLAVTIVLLIAVLVGGNVVDGARRWLVAGPISIQPSELAKLAMVLCLADVLSRKPHRLQEWRDALMPALPLLTVLAALVLRQPDLGTALVLAGITLGMLVVAGVGARILAACSIGGGAIGMLLIWSAAYRRNRFLAFLDPFADRMGGGYQAVQSLYSLGSGGVAGVGLGASRQKWFFLPNAHTDFVFAILGEELGLLGTVSVLVLFGAFALLGIRIALRAPDLYGTLVAAGVVIWVLFQAIVNIGAVTAVLPITGVPLPFLSSGGSSLLTLLAACGLLLSIARQGVARPGRR